MEPKKDDTSDRKLPAGRIGSEPPVWALVLVAAAFFSLPLLQWLPLSWRTHIPPVNSGYGFAWIAGGTALAFMLSMLANKLLQARRAAKWPQAIGRITKSGVIAKSRQMPGEPSEMRNEPAVEYEFQVAGRSFTGTRIAIGGDKGGANTEATLKLYAVGTVVKVYYDPADPENTVLERDIPTDVPKGCAILLGFAGLVGLAGYWIYAEGFAILASHLPAGRAPLVLFAGLFGLFILLFYVSYRARAKQASQWPRVQGVIVRSGIESFEEKATDDNRARTLYSPQVEYGYKVAGHEYHSRQILLGGKISGSLAYAEKVAARYPKGRGVEVRHDPANPGEAALDISTGPAWLMLVAAAACFGVAVYAGGLAG